MSKAEEKLRELGLELPTPPAPVANYVGAVRTGTLVFVSGHGPVRDGDVIFKGKLGRDLDAKAGYEAARLVMLNCLASLKREIGDLDKVTRIVKLLGMVNSVPEFDQQPAVINGASDLLTKIFGDGIAKHARSAVGMSALPDGISVEIEMIVEAIE
jgi:enamine deaminase RidA (YjgF/YER057c/UK114 family)